MLFFHVSCNPKYERLHNLIQKKTSEKNERESKMEMVIRKNQRKYSKDGRYESLGSDEHSFDRSNSVGLKTRKVKF